MRIFLVMICLTTWARAQHGRAPRQNGQYENHSNGNGWDIRLAVPGEPGNDYPTLGAIPRTSFSCAGKLPGYYADLETNCQAFRVCTSGSTYGFQSFLCPNGTLFNQAVFVCDWWMNVNCQKSQELFSGNNDKFGNLKLGPQLMKDIKKMITHTMRNPYDKSVMKSNLVVMQEYRPPAGQMFPNGALINGPQRSPNSIYVPAKQTQQNYKQYNNNGYAASSPSPSYIPPPLTAGSPQRDAEVFQRQRQNDQYQQSGRQSGRLQSTQSTAHLSNSHAGQYSSQNVAQNYNNQYGQRQQNSFGLNHNYNTQNTQIQQQSARFTDDSRNQQNNGFTRQQYNYPNPNQAYTNTLLPLANEHGQNEAKQNLVSGDVPATIITKTLTFNRIVQPKPGNPKSRITVKTWVVKPSKAAKLIAEPTPYAYDRPTNPPPAKIISSATPYVYNPPTAQTAKIIAEPGYSYSRPTSSAKQISTTPSRLYLNPTLPPPPPTLSRLYLNPTTAPPTLASRLYIPPTTYKPAANLYIPPSQTNLILSRQYLAPSALQQPAYYQSEQLQASPTSPAPVYAAPPSDKSFSLTKHSHINANHNNLTFADILTKEKLDITVNDIVSDTSKILKTASPPTFGQLRQEKTEDYVEENYLAPDNSESGEKLTPQSPTVQATSARLVAPDISRDLEPPVESYGHVQNTNRLANLPFYKEPGTGTNTIERTVSLKISIPEKVAYNLFKNRNGTDSDYDKLEILNTGSSNYLVLTNNLLTKNNGASFIPIGRLIADKNTNLSDSQALVFSFLADSLNVAKEYSNIAKENIVSPTPSQIQNVNSEELSQITNKISQLTASQYAGNQNQNYNHANIVSTSQTSTVNSNEFRPAKYTNGYEQNQQVSNQQQNQNAQINLQPQQQSNQGYPRYQSGNLVNLPLTNHNNVYSGQLYQLPVPDVTNHIYNAGSANLIQSNDNGRQHLELAHLNAANHNNHNNVGNNLSKQSSAEVEIIRSHTVPLSPAKLQLAPSNEAESFNSHEHSALIGNFLNNDNGISAQLQDKIVGTIPHPIEDNKLVTYKKDQTYVVYTKLNNGNSQVQNNQQQQQNAKIVQNPLIFQFVPSVGYQLDDEKEQQRILNAFNIDEYGNPRKLNHQEHNRRDDNLLTSEVDYSVDHPSAKQVSGQYNDINTLYTGPSSYSAPQASVGSLEAQPNPNSLPARLELEENKGYSRVTPERQFTY